ncbi:hypothetical protein FHU42_000358 [Corynebacterium glutamicum]|nr:hypothetical protein [Corynebacterium glutamicum]
MKSGLCSARCFLLYKPQIAHRQNRPKFTNDVSSSCRKTSRVTTSSPPSTGGEHDVISILLECARLCSLRGPRLRIEPFAPGGVNAKSTFARLSVCCGNPQFCKMTSGKPKHSAPNIVPHKDKKTGIHPVVTKRLGLSSYASLPKGNKGTRLRRRVPCSPDMPLMAFNLC